MKKVKCISCGHVWKQDDLDYFLDGEPTCPICGGDEFDDLE